MGHIFCIFANFMFIRGVHAVTTERTEQTVHVLSTLTKDNGWRYYIPVWDAPCIILQDTVKAVSVVLAFIMTCGSQLKDKSEFSSRWKSDTKSPIQER